MRYQTSIFPTNDEGNFLVAIYFSSYPVGGENTYLTSAAHFFMSSVNAPTIAHDLTTRVTIMRAASASDAGVYAQAASTQREMANESQGDPAGRARFEANAAEDERKTILAGQDGVTVPRRVYVSREGTVLLGFAQSTGSHLDTPRVMCRCLTLDTKTQKWDVMGQENPGTAAMAAMSALTTAPDGPSLLSMLKLMTSAVLPTKSSKLPAKLDDLAANAAGRPQAISHDGKRAIFIGMGSPAAIPMEFATDASRKRMGQFPQPAQTYLPTAQGWVLVGMDSVSVFEFDMYTPKATWKLPKAFIPYQATVSRHGRWLASATERGSVCVMDMADGSTRQFFPHAGAGADTQVNVAINDQGGMLATRIGSDLVLTNLADGLSWKAATLNQHARPATANDPTSAIMIETGFAFVGATLVCADSTGVHCCSNVPTPDQLAGAIVSEKGRARASAPIKVTNSGSLTLWLAEARLERAAAALTAYHSPAATIKVKSIGKNASPHEPSASLGRSRFGGWPDLPRAMAWPFGEGRPMAFLGQINLAEAHAVTPGLRLPTTGLLSFFLGSADDVVDHGDDTPPFFLVELMPVEKRNGRSWLVHYQTDLSDLVRLEYAQTPRPQTFSPCALSFERATATLPDENTLAYEALPLDDLERDRYNQLLAQLAPDEDRNADCQLMGYPQLIQWTPPEGSCVLAEAGKDIFAFPEPNSPEYPAFVASANQWSLLLQLTSDSEADFLWGDAGHFYFYGNREAMARGDFSSVQGSFEN